MRVGLALPLALFYVWAAAPTPRPLVAGAVIAAIGILVRAAASGHIEKHGKRLVTSGPYAWTRNPLYLGTALLGIGLLIAGCSLSAGALGTAYFLLFYPATMLYEQRKLRVRYGTAFDEYVARVPFFWPRVRQPRSPRPGFSWANYWRNREYQAALALFLVLAVLWMKMRHPV
jgi:protein-S-isoprenylcysteine O-methyltransferase Ste14